MDVELTERLDRIEGMLATPAKRQVVKEWYTTEEVARIVGRAEFTIRERGRGRRVHARKKESGRGRHTAWVISHAELQRIQREGLLPPPEQPIG